MLRRKVTLKAALKPHRIPAADRKAVQAIYDTVEGREQRVELNLYIVGEDEEPKPDAVGTEAAETTREEDAASSPEVETSS